MSDNKWPVRIASLGLAFVLALAGCKTPVTTVLLVRHAEKEGGNDPSLTPAGADRAQALIDVTDQTGLTAIYTTQWLRTKETAEPTATALGLVPTVFETAGSAGQHADDLAADIYATHEGGRVLVVGHSNTVPLIVSALGVSSAPSIGESEFDRLFIVIKEKKKPARLIEARYGD